MEFVKMHGLGNDYIFISGDSYDIKNPSALSVFLSDRHFGVGGDGIVIYKRLAEKKYSMRIFNSDGSEAEICGNALRCLCKLIAEKYIANNKVRSENSNGYFNHMSGTIAKLIRLSENFFDLSIVTKAGERHCRAYLDEDNLVKYSMVDMGKPENLDELERIDCGGKKITIAGNTYEYIPVNVGNPHAVIFTNKAISDEEFYSVAPLIEKNQIFKNGTNIEFVTVQNGNRVAMRVWERGSGETLACGSGACAVAVACAIMKKTAQTLFVQCDGGELIIHYDGNIYMLGEASLAFGGIVNIAL